jgi:putative flavoprotein involved in K+ transport
MLPADRQRGTDLVTGEKHTQVVIVGGGQAGLAAGYHLRRLGLDFVILDAQAEPGGAWQHAWDSLHLFSPAAYSSLPGRPMPLQSGQTYPDARHVVGYLTEYERRYSLPVYRPVRVSGIHRDGAFLRVETDSGDWRAQAVISATGTWWRPLPARRPRAFGLPRTPAAHRRVPRPARLRRAARRRGGRRQLRRADRR